jgi:hypothetical protein
MATYKVRVEDRVGAINDDAALSDWLTSGAKFITNILPLERLEKFTVNLTSDPTTGVSVVAHRVLSANKAGYGARKVPQELTAQVVNTGSIHYAGTTDPVWYILNGSAFVKPAGGTVVAMAYPTVAYGDSTITAFPADLDEGVVLYASIQGRLRQISDLAITTLGGLSISTITPPTAPAAISVTYTNTDTALTNQDVELAQGHLSKVHTQISEYGAKLQLYTVDTSVYSNKIQEEAARISGRISQYNSQYQQLNAGLATLKTEFNDYLKSL